MKTSLMIRFCLLLFLVISAGCARPFFPAESAKPTAQPIDIDRLKARAAFWRDYSSKFRLRVESKTSKFSSRAIILVKSPNFVRFETFTPIGQTAALYVSNDTGPALLIPSEKVIFTAQRPETLVHEFLGIDLPVDLFRYALTATIPPDQLEHIENRADSASLRLISSSGGSYFEWRLAANASAIEGLSVRSAGFEGRVSYDPPVEISKEAVPSKIRLSSRDWTMEVDIEELRPSKEFQPTAFYMPNSPDLKKANLDKTK